MHRTSLTICLTGMILLAGCRSLPFTRADPLAETPPPINTALPIPTFTALIVASDTPPPSPSSLPSATVPPARAATTTLTPVPTHTFTPTITLTPTYAFPVATGLMRAFCRYGPGKAYLYAHEINAGDQAEVNGRNAASTWLWVEPPGLDWHCWVAASVVTVSGDISTVVVVQPSLPHSSLYNAPKNVRAVRAGDQVTVSWSRVHMTQDDDRGYLIEASLCQGGNRVEVAVHTEDTSYQFNDESGCAGASGGRLYTVEKHGYTDPVVISWP